MSPKQVAGEHRERRTGRRGGGNKRVTERRGAEGALELGKGRPAGAGVEGGCDSDRPCSLTMAVPAWSSGMQPLSWARRRAGPEPAPRLSRRGGSRRLRRAAAPGSAQASASFPQKLEVQHPQPQPQPDPERRLRPREVPPSPTSSNLAPPPLSLRRLRCVVSTRRSLSGFSPSRALKGLTPPEILSYL